MNEGITYERYIKTLKQLDEIPLGSLMLRQNDDFQRMSHHPIQWWKYQWMIFTTNLENFFIPRPKYGDEKTTPIKLESTKVFASKTAKTGVVGYFKGLVSVLRSYHRERGWKPKSA